MEVDACEIRSGINLRFSVIVYVEHGGRKKFQHTWNKAVCFAKCYEFRVRKMNKTYHRSSNATVFREHPAAVEMRRASKSHIDFAGDIHVSRAWKPGDKFFLLETLICDIRSLMRTSRKSIRRSTMEI